MYQSIINSIKPKMQEVISQLMEKFSTVRAGKANISLVENIQVSYYNTQTPLKQMASISTPSANMVVIQPWDKNSLGDIELAIRNSNLGFSPVNDGRTVRIVFPQLTEEKRQELAKYSKSLSEEAKVALRGLRGEVWQEIKNSEKAGKITEDDRYRAEEELNKTIEDFNTKIAELLERKEKEIMTI